MIVGRFLLPARCRTRWKRALSDLAKVAKIFKTSFLFKLVVNVDYLKLIELSKLSLFY